jgi:hypothetical protein
VCLPGSHFRYCAYVVEVGVVRCKLKVEDRAETVRYDTRRCVLKFLHAERKQCPAPCICQRVPYEEHKQQFSCTPTK